MVDTRQPGHVERLIVRAAGVRPIREPAANGRCARCEHADHGAFGLPCPEVIVSVAEHLPITGPISDTGRAFIAEPCGCPPERLG